MKLIDVLKNVDRSESNAITWFEFGKMFRELGIELTEYGSTPHDTIFARLKAYWLYHWLCTDTTVGGVVYFFDDEVLAYSTQHARKSDTEFHFVRDPKLMERFKLWGLSLLQDSTPDGATFDPDEEIDPTFRVEFAGQCQMKRGTYFNRPVLVSQLPRKEQWDTIRHDVRVDYQDELEPRFEEVNIYDICFPYALAPGTVKEESKSPSP